MSEFTMELAPGIDLVDMGTAKMIAEHLDKHYPFWMWSVNANRQQGVVRIWTQRLSGKYGYILLYPSFENDPSLKAVTKAGGEILERFRMARGAANDTALHDKQAVAGEFAFDYQNIKNTRVSDAMKMRWDFFK